MSIKATEIISIKFVLQGSTAIWCLQLRRIFKRLNLYLVFLRSVTIPIKSTKYSQSFTCNDNLYEYNMFSHLRTSHVCVQYMSAGMVTVSGRSVLEAGWRGRVPVVAHHGCVFPGETVPMLLPHAGDAAMVAQAIKENRLFGLLCPEWV